MKVISSVQFQIRQILDSCGIQHLHIVGFQILYRLLFGAVEYDGSCCDVATGIIIECLKITC